MAVAVLTGAAVWETRTSTLQARYFSGIAAKARFRVVDRPSVHIRFPATGPIDKRFGYTALSTLIPALEQRGYRIDRQAEVTYDFAALVDRGIFAPYREKLQGGLVVRDTRGSAFFAAPSPRQVYATFESMPEVLWRILLFIEGREFLAERYPKRNPAVEWDRLAKATFDLALQALGSDRNVPGASTLATQLEKFRHSADGLTRSAREKIGQMESAAVRAYLDGPDTLESRRRVVRDYVNSVPLAAQRGHGEVVGTADGLFAWYGTSFEEANRLLGDASGESGDVVRRGEVLRQAVSLMIAHRRPSYYLVSPPGRDDLAALTDAYLGLLDAAAVVPPRLVASARDARVTLLGQAPERPPAAFIQQKAANQIRTHLLSILSIPRLYDLDRFDLAATATLDMRWQTPVADLFARLEHPEEVVRLGFAASSLLDRGDPSKVIYSFTLMETTPLGNVVRVQTDNYDGPLSFAQASRVELGSTAKLRALVTYLEVIAELHGRLAMLSPDALGDLPIARQDVLSRWVRDALLARPNTDLRSMLDRAMERRYSANPAERFATGGGTQTFANFDRTHNQSVLTVSEAFRQSVNLPVIRLMRDVVRHFTFRSPETTARVLEDVNDLARPEYLARFADREGGDFVRQFYSKYRGLDSAQLLDTLTANRRLGPQRMAWALRAVIPEVDVDTFAEALVARLANDSLSRTAVEDLYRRSDASALDVNDLGYLARIHPLELWVVRYLVENPGAELAEILDESRTTRQAVYRWLFRTSRRNAQDQRIRTMLELEAFQEILLAWQRVGYPFNNIVPSFGTAIGSSGDRPIALAELVGIILNDGIRYPIVRVDTLHFAEHTPFETRMVKTPTGGERVMPSAVATVARLALVDVVENGTGRRAIGALLGGDGSPLRVGGKTGTGDNRYRVFGPGGQMIESRPVNRTSTFAFLAGDRYFGVVTAYVPGEEAGAYRFTSALPAEILKRIGVALGPLSADDEAGVGAP